MSTPNRKSVEQQLQEAMAEIEALKARAREEAVSKAKYPWENPEIVQEQPRVAYNFKWEPELYLKVKWLLDNKAGMKSMQVFLDRAATKLADEYLEELGAK